MSAPVRRRFKPVRVRKARWAEAGQAGGCGRCHVPILIGEQVVSVQRDRWVHWECQRIRAATPG